MKYLLILFPLLISVARGGDSFVLVGNGFGPGGPAVKEFDATTSTQIDSFFGFNQQFTGGVRVAMADINGDGVPDIILGAGPGGTPTVSVFDGATGSLLASFFAFAPSFSGGVYVAAGDVNGDGVPDIVVGADAGGAPQVAVFDGKSLSLINSFFAYAPQFTGGVRVAVGDFNGFGHADIITAPGPGGGPEVKVFDGANGQVLNSFMAFPPTFMGGLFVAAGELRGPNTTDIIVGAGPGGSPTVATFDGATLSRLDSFFAFDPTFTGGVRVAVTDAGNGGTQNIVAGAGPGGGPEVRIFSGGVFLVATLRLDHAGTAIDDFLAFNASDTNGVFVAGLPLQAYPKASISAVARGVFQLQVSGTPGLSYQIFTATSLFNPDWTLLTNFQMAASGSNAIQDTAPDGLPAKFYKLLPALR